MQITFNVQSMTDSGEYVVVQLSNQASGNPSAAGLYVPPSSLSLTLSKEEASDFFPGDKYTVTLAEATA